MEIKSDGVSREEPDEAAVRKDDLGTEVDGLEEEEDAKADGGEVVALFPVVALEGGESGFIVAVVHRLAGGDADAGPEATGHDEEDGREEEGVVVSEPSDGGGRCECS